MQATRPLLPDFSRHVHPKLVNLDLRVLVRLFRLCQIADLVFFSQFDFVRPIFWPSVNFCDVPFVRVCEEELRFYLHFETLPFRCVRWYTELYLCKFHIHSRPLQHFSLESVFLLRSFFWAHDSALSVFLVLLQNHLIRWHGSKGFPCALSQDSKPKFSIKLAHPRCQC